MKRKIKLNQIRVKSFVTALSNVNLIKGGSDGPYITVHTMNLTEDETKTSSGETESPARCVASQLNIC